MSNTTISSSLDIGDIPSLKGDIISFVLIGLSIAVLSTFAILGLSGCTQYKGGKVVDGTNIEIGMTIPGTQWTINFLSYTGGMKIGANDGARLVVTNETTESNSFFGVVSTSRKTKLVAAIEPTIANEIEETTPPQK
jgi:hypothetical protein